MMPVPSVHCEARKLAYRQSKDGLVVSFTIHPDEMPATLAAAPLGQRYMLVLAAIGDDEEPVPQTGPVDSGSVVRTPTNTNNGARERYHNAPPEDQAVYRAGILCANKQFQKWVSAKACWECDETDVTDWLRQMLGIKSRKEIASDPGVREAFLKIETDYLVETGQTPEVR